MTSGEIHDLLSGTGPSSENDTMEKKSRRREFLKTAAAVPTLLSSSAVAKTAKRPRVAAIFTVLRFRSHAFNILENFLGPYYFNGTLMDPGVDVVSFYADQFPNDDMAREVSRRPMLRLLLPGREFF